MLNGVIRSMRRVAVFTFIPLFFSANQAEAQEYWPTETEWETISPVDANMDPFMLRVAIQWAAQNDSGSLMVLRGGKIVAEIYWQGHTAETRLSIASSTKSMTAIMVGMALDDGKFNSINQSVSDFHTPWKGNPKEKITLRHLLTMTSGLNPELHDIELVEEDQFVLNASMPMRAIPGTHWEYNTPAYDMLYRLIEKATGKSMEAYAQKKLFDPLGMKDTEWEKNGVGSVTNYYQVKSTARDMARFGVFALRGGQWNGKQLISPAFFKDATTSSQELNPAYGYLWWLNARKGKAASETLQNAIYQFDGSPRDTIACLGSGGQNIAVIPSKDLVIVRQGGTPKKEEFQETLLKLLLRAAEKISEN